MDWSTWVQGLTKTAVDLYGAKEQRDYEIQKLRLQEDVAQATAAEARVQAMTLSGAASGLGVSPGVLVLGGVALLAVLMLKD